MAGKNLFWYMDGLGSLSEIMFRIYIDGDYLCLYKCFYFIDH